MRKVGTSDGPGRLRANYLPGQREAGSQEVGAAAEGDLESRQLRFYMEVLCGSIQARQGKIFYQQITH